MKVVAARPSSSEESSEKGKEVEVGGTTYLDFAGRVAMLNQFIAASESAMAWAVRLIPLDFPLPYISVASGFKLTNFLFFGEKNVHTEITS